MIEFFQEWLQEFVPHVTQPENSGLQNNSKEINDVTHVPPVTHQNTESRQIMPESSHAPSMAGENPLQPIFEGYKGCEGYHADSKTTSAVTHDGKGWVTRVTDSELEGSMRRLEAENILLAVNEDGDLRIVRSEAVAHQAAMDGFTIYTPKDAYMYVALTERERRMLHSFKRTFNASIEWRDSK